MLGSIIARSACTSRLEVVAFVNQYGAIWEAESARSTRHDLRDIAEKCFVFLGNGVVGTGICWHHE